MTKSIILTSIVAIFLCISFNKTACTQGIVSEENQWNVLSHEFTSFYMNTAICTIHGDSSVNSHEYERMWAYFVLTYETFPQGLLREDSNRVYYIYPGDAEEGLLYDFNAEIGDTCYIISCFENDAFPVYVTNIDTTEYFDVERKRWFLVDDYGNEDFWIEGIGSSYGPLHNMMRHSNPPYWEFHLLCYYHSDTILYRKEGYSSCIITHVGLDEASTEKDIHIYPNPARDKFEVRSMEFGVNVIQIFDMTGRKVIEKSLPAGTKEFDIDISRLNPGIYYCRFLNAKKLIAKRLLKL